MKTFQHILVALDDSFISSLAAEHALSIAKQFQSKVTFVSVIPVDPFASADFYKVAPAITSYFEQAQDNARAQLQEFQQSFAHEHIETEIQLLHGVTPSEGILETASTVGADLIIMGSHGRRGLNKIMLGSVAQNVLSKASAPVIVVKKS